MKLVLLLVVAVVAACGTKANPASCLDDHCSDPARPFCDEDGSIGGEPNKCIAVSCNPGEFAACRDDRALTCNATGNNYEQLDCEFGCSEEAGGCNACNTSECERHIIPKYLPNVCNQLIGGEPATVSSNATIDTSDPNQCHSIVAQAAGPDICVYRRSSISLGRNATWSISGKRAIAFVADHDITIEGILDVSASYDSFQNKFTDGPGSGLVLSGGTGAYPNGGGGAGFKTMGGAGGTQTADGGAGNGGAAAINPAQLAILVSGTQPEPSGMMFRNAGGGGGAATLIACRGTISVPGMIDAGGSGGAGHYGGGSGGNVVLQGMMVNITGELFANGGGGGGGLPGEDAKRDTQPALGGPKAASYWGDGGHGGTGTLLPGNGKLGSDAAGGGGGSVGFFQVYVPTGVQSVLTPVRASPQLEVPATVATNR